MRDFRSILNIIGILICIEAVAMLIPMFFDLYYGNYDWLQFFYSSLITFFIGIILYFSIASAAAISTSSHILYLFSSILHYIHLQIQGFF